MEESNQKGTEQFKLPAKLEMLLSMVLETGEISEKELAVLRAEAQKHDISEGELDIIIAHRLKKQTTVIDNNANSGSSNDIDKIIRFNTYSPKDSVSKIFHKYETLCENSDKCEEKFNKEKLYRAQLAFVHSIVLPNDKEAALDLIAQAIPYSHDSLSVPSSLAGLKDTVTRIGFGILSQFLPTKHGGSTVTAEDKKERAQFVKRMCEKAEESLVDAWNVKIEELIKNAEIQFDGDKQFKIRLASLKSQFNASRKNEFSL